MPIAGRPKSENRKEVTSISITPQVTNWFKKRAQLEGRSFSEIVRTALDAYMRQQDKKKGRVSI